MKNSLIVRSYRLDDIADLISIEQTSNPHALNKTQLLSSFSNQNNQTFVITAPLADEQIVGFIIYQISYDTADIVHLVISRAYHGCGYAKSLLKKTLKQLSGRNRVLTCFLEVRSSNKRAISLYRHVGFTPISTRKAYYKSPTEDACVMSLRL